MQHVVQTIRSSSTKAAVVHRTRTQFWKESVFCAWFRNLEPLCRHQIAPFIPTITQKIIYFAKTLTAPLCKFGFI